MQRERAKEKKKEASLLVKTLLVRMSVKMMP